MLEGEEQRKVERTGLDERRCRRCRRGRNEEFLASLAAAVRRRMRKQQRKAF
jgi:hypothetical protein